MIPESATWFITIGKNFAFEMTEAIMNKRTLKNDFLQIEYLTTSLRITGLVPAGKSNLLADLSRSPPTPNSVW